MERKYKVSLLLFSWNPDNPEDVDLKQENFHDIRFFKDVENAKAFYQVARDHMKPLDGERQ